jgi:hypothetical protein
MLHPMTLETLRASAAGEDVERYRALLRANWSRETLDAVFSLLWKLLAKSMKSSSVSWRNVLACNRTAKKSTKELNQDVLHRIRSLSLVFTEPALPVMPSAFPATRSSRLVALAEQAWTFLTLQALVSLEGETGLVADAQSLLFLCSAHFLLPQLQQRGLTAERNCLVCAMYVHTLLVWRTQPAHYLYLQSVLMDHLGEQERRLELLDQSFHMTPPADHCYLTKATAYWSELMDLRRYEKASNFLFFLTKHAPDFCQEEIKEMLSETLVEANNGSK